MLVLSTAEFAHFW